MQKIVDSVIGYTFVRKQII